MDNLQSERALGGLRVAHETLRRQETEVARLVAEARAQGASWGDVGRELGVSKQAAWERWRLPGSEDA